MTLVVEIIKYGYLKDNINLSPTIFTIIMQKYLTRPDKDSITHTTFFFVNMVGIVRIEKLQK